MPRIDSETTINTPIQPPKTSQRLSKVQQKKPMTVETLSEFADTASYLTTDRSHHAIESSFTPPTTTSCCSATTSFSDFNLDPIAEDLYTDTEASNSSFYLSPSHSNLVSAAIPTLPIEEELDLMGSWWNANPLSSHDPLADIAVESLPFSSTLLESQDWITDTTWMTSYSATVPITTSHLPVDSARNTLSAAGRAMISGYSADSEEYDETYGSSDESDSSRGTWTKRT
jgi:hypothetical protein